VSSSKRSDVCGDYHDPPSLKVIKTHTDRSSTRWLMHSTYGLYEIF